MSRDKKLVYSVVRLMAFVLFVGAVAVVVVAAKLGVFSNNNPDIGWIARLYFFDRFAVDALAVSFVAGLLLLGSRIIRSLAFLIIAAYVAVVSIQTFSLVYGGEFLNRVALENANHINYFLKPANFVIFGAIGLITIGQIRLSRACQKSGGEQSMAAVMLITVAALGAFFNQSGRYLPESVKEQRRNLQMSVLFPHTSPILQLVRVLRPGDNRKVEAVFTRDELTSLEQMGFTLRPAEKYPLARAQFYQSQAPFGGDSTSAEDKPNVIIFFFEGTSARSLNCYGSKWEALTPNFDRLAALGMKVENYFNHTAATYRGLHGQLCSIFPKYEGAEGSDMLKTVERNSYYCLQNVFKRLGYRTSFFNSHSKDDSYTDEMMQYLKFQEVLSGEAIAAKYLGGSGLNVGGYALSDRQLLSGLVERLKHQQASASKQPFFIALYSLETHANLNTNATDGLRYADGENPSLNTIHNLDGALGDFLDYFLESSYATNTILIVTADHAHYHEEPFITVFNDSDYQRLFVDRIPLIIYDPRQQLPRILNPGIATSIDLAPTVAHLIGIQNQENGFLGTSIFETAEGGKRSSAIASYSDLFYYLVDGKIHGEENSREYTRERQLTEKFVRYSHYLEDQNRLWHPSQPGYASRKAISSVAQPAGSWFEPAPGAHCSASPPAEREQCPRTKSSSNTACP